MIRIISGAAKGRNIDVPKEAKTRPTTDRVREAMFNSLYKLGDPPVPQDSKVLDLFAGSGALGIEALSRGASSATFVDHDSDAIKTVHSNLSQLGLRDSAEIIRFDAMSYLKTLDLSHDLVFLDPPFAFDNWTELLKLLENCKILVIGSDREIEVPDETWEIVKAAKYSSTYIKICINIK